MKILSLTRPHIRMYQNTFFCLKKHRHKQKVKKKKNKEEKKRKTKGEKEKDNFVVNSICGKSNLIFVRLDVFFLFEQ